MSTVVFFCPTKTWGGVEKNVLVRAKFLSEKQHHIYVILLNGLFAEKFVSLQNTHVINVSKRGGDLNLKVIYNYLFILKKIKPDVVFVSAKKDWFLASLASKMAGINKVILYLGIKRKIKVNLKYKFIFKVLKPVMVVNSNSLKNHLLKTTPYFNDHNLYKIYNGFNIPTIDKSFKLETTNNLAIPNNSILIGCAGRFSTQKGFDLLPKIIENLPKNVHFIHAGGQGNQEQEVKEFINNSDYKNRIHFLGQLSDMNPFFNSIDLFLLCSRWEGMANVLNEALSYGVPSVSTKVDGSQELLANGKFGILTEIDNVKEMSAAINAILDNKQTFNSKDLTKHILTNFSMNKMILETEKVFFS